MVGVSSSSVLSLSTLSMCNGSVGCVSSLSSPKLACLCEKRLMLFESLRDGIIRMCPYELFESTNDLVSVVCVENAFVVEKGSAIGTSLIQLLILECISPVFCFAQCSCPQSHSSGISNVFDQWALHTTIHMCSCQCCAINHKASSVAVWVTQKKKGKKDYDTWCSQVVSNPSTNQARRGLTSLIRREVVLSSWYGRNSFSFSATPFLA